MATGSMDTTAKLWHVGEGKELCTLAVSSYCLLPLDAAYGSIGLCTNVTLSCHSAHTSAFTMNVHWYIMNHACIEAEWYQIVSARIPSLCQPGSQACHVQCNNSHVLCRV